MVGSGKTAADPRRPEYAPVPVPGRAPVRSGITSFSYQTSDDGNYALVEFVAFDKAAFKNLLADKRPDVKVFEKGKAKKSDVEQEFRKYKKDFDLDRFLGTPGRRP